jgi:uncharacterized protein (DUF1810 family)
MSLERFHAAQADPRTGFATAVAELRAAAKRGHWIWYVFPQLEGLGRSAMARHYALRDFDEACSYLQDPVLRTRYEEISNVVADQLARGVLIETLMGGSIDGLKLVSSVTLFHAVAEELARLDPGYGSLATRLSAILEQTAAQGYPVCNHTVARLGSRKRAPFSR